MENDPFARMPDVPEFDLVSTDVATGSALPRAQLSKVFGVEGGQDRSPELSWSGEPEGTKSFFVFMFDPDAPTVSGFWHWMLVDLPATTHHLDAGAGDGVSPLPGSAFHLPNDARQPRFVGGAPPPGDSRHRYYLAVHALGIERSQVPRDSTPSLFVFNVYPHILGRAVIEAWARLPPT